MSPPVQTSDHAVFTSCDQLQTRPSESYAEEVYWADLPAAKRTRWMLQRQVCPNFAVLEHAALHLCGTPQY